MSNLTRCAPFLLLSGCLFAQTSPSDPAATLHHFSPSQVDTSIAPCDDFFAHACSKYFREHPIPADEVAWGTTNPLQLYSENILKETMIAAAGKKTGRTANEQKIGDYWTACMDESGRNKTGASELNAQLKRIDAIKDMRGLITELATVHAQYPGAWQVDNNQTNSALFGFTALPDYDDATQMFGQFDQGGMHLPGRDFYLSDDQKSKDIRAKYLAHIAKMLGLVGETPEQAQRSAQVILAFETDLAKNAMDNISRRDPKNINTKMTLAQLTASAPSLHLEQYLTLIKAPRSGKLLVTSPKFFTALEALTKSHPLAEWKTYLKYDVIKNAAPLLSDPFVNESFDFFQKTLYGNSELLPRWRRCVQAADRDLGEALGQAYVQRVFPPAAKQKALELVKSIESALDQDIVEISWMQPETKGKAKEKLHLILDKIGYPDKFRDYSAVKITPASYLANVNAASDFEYRRWINKIGKPVDRYDWTMTPPTINAYYDAQFNTINFPAGILQPPFFDPQGDAALNLGGIGMVIGHEIVHGFDDQGRKFDGRGNLRDWWTSADAQQYEQRGKCISDQYTQEVKEYGVKTNGLLTQGEDTADNGGMTLAWKALNDTLQKEGKAIDAKGEDGLTAAQRFFLSYANIWCTDYRPELARTVILTNPHSIPRFRVNNVLQNMPAFATAFQCKPGQTMVREKTCRVW